MIQYEKNDEYFTPKMLVEPILEFINPKSKIWCPFDTSKSEFVKTFKENGFNVVNSHILTGQDFFSYQPKNWDLVVSNPPFSKKYEILERLLIFRKPFALVFGIQILNNGIFNKIVKNHKWNLQILTFTKRATYDGNNCSFMTAYICYKFLKSKSSCYIVKDLATEEFKLSQMNDDKIKKPIQLRLFEN